MAVITAASLTLGALVAAPPASSGPLVRDVLDVLDDTYTYPQASGWAPGNQTSMKASSYPAIEGTAWVRFRAPSGETGTAPAATLEIPVVRATPDVVVDVYAAPTNWREETMTHSSAPSLGSPIATVTSVGSVLKVDVSGHADSEAVSAFAIRSRGTDKAVVFGTKEGGNPARLVMSAGGSVAPPPPPGSITPGSVTTLFGASVEAGSNSWGEAVADADRRFGRLAVIRVFYPSAPLAWPGRAGSVVRPVVVSFKLPPGEVINGRHDSRLTSWFSSAPRDRDIYWSFYHEPEDDVQAGRFSASKYKSAWQRISALARQHGGDNLRATLIVMNWTLSKGSGRDFYDYYPGDEAIDVIAVDAYNTSWRSGTYKDAGAIVGPVGDLARSRGKQFGIAEVGSRDVSGDARGFGRAQWLREVAAEARKRDAAFVTYWNARGKDSDFRLDDQPSITAWREAVASSG